MGVDIRHSKDQTFPTNEPRSQDGYLLLVKLYRFLAR